MILRCAWFFGLCYWWLGSAAVAADLSQQRQMFHHAVKLAQTHQTTEYRRLRAQLEDYALAPYLDFLYLEHRLSHSSEAEILDFLQAHPGHYFTERIRQMVLERAGTQGNWSLLLQAYQAPQAAQRDCLYGRALLATGAQEAAESVIQRLWLVPKSQHSHCDPLFAQASAAGLIDDDLRWQRLLLSLEDRQFSLANFLARQVRDSDAAQAWVNRWQRMDQNPDSLLGQLPVTPPAGEAVSLARDVPLARQIIVMGLERLARQSPEKAYRHWLRIRSHYAFSAADRNQVHSTIGRWAAIKREGDPLAYFGDAQGEVWKVRAALWAGNWRTVIEAIDGLSEADRALPRWRYWRARALAELGDTDAAHNLYSQAANERDFFSFLAADQLNQPYAMQDRPIRPDTVTLNGFLQRPEIRALQEFQALGMDTEARRQLYFLQTTYTGEALHKLAMLPHQWGWHPQTIAILGRAQYWDALDFRFPLAFAQELEHGARQQSIDPSWVMAVARQESAFNPSARSPAGALGLMQVMPETGKQVANRLNRPLRNTQELLDPNRSIELGSAYLRQMLDRYQNNPVLATASYNAGPHRTLRWLPEQAMPADIWVENIPFTETRRYVRSVLSFAAIFDYRRGAEIVPMQARMPRVQPKAP